MMSRHEAEKAALSVFERVEERGKEQEEGRRRSARSSLLSSFSRSCHSQFREGLLRESSILFRRSGRGEDGCKIREMETARRASREAHEVEDELVD